MKKLRTLLFGNNYFQKLKKELDDLKLIIGRQLAHSLVGADSLHGAEFKVFSQWGDDGIIQYLINRITLSNKYFVEFGVENYTEANTRFLLINNNWSGLIMDGSAANINEVKSSDIYWKYELKAQHAFVTVQNINGLLTNLQVPENIGLLHIDIDGNDYWIWKNITAVKADIIIVEYNSGFGAERSITVPYNESFQRTEAHYSNLYYGCSLPALCNLAKEKGYAFVGCNSAGNNAYFVLNEKLGSLKPLNAAEGYVQSKFKESRNTDGTLSYLSGNQRLEKIKGLEVFNTLTNQLEKL